MALILVAIANIACGEHASGQKVPGAKTVISGPSASALAVAFSDFETTIRPSEEQAEDRFFSDLRNYEVSIAEAEEGFVVVFSVVARGPRIGETEDGRITLDLTKGGGGRYVVRDGRIVVRELFR